MLEKLKCEKCGVEEGTLRKTLRHGNMPVHVISHHANGYTNNAPIMKLCRSCHYKLHFIARKNGRCKVPVDDLEKLSKKFRCYTTKRINFTNVMNPDVELAELIEVHRSGHVRYNSYFHALHSKSLWYEEI